jgi:hypothetical protein
MLAEHCWLPCEHLSGRARRARASAAAPEHLQDASRALHRQQPPARVEAQRGHALGRGAAQRAGLLQQVAARARPAAGRAPRPGRCGRAGCALLRSQQPVAVQVGVGGAHHQPPLIRVHVQRPHLPAAARRLSVCHPAGLYTFCKPCSARNCRHAMLTLRYRSHGESGRRHGVKAPLLDALAQAWCKATA